MNLLPHLLLLGTLLGSCKGTIRNWRLWRLPFCDSSWKADYQAAVALWSDVPCYAFTFQRSCECLPKYTDPYRVIVENNTITSVVSVRDGAVVADKQLIDSIPTVSEMFDDIESLCLEGYPMNSPASCVAVYDATDGHVASLFVDEDKMLADEETIYTVADLVITTCQPPPQEDDPDVCESSWKIDYENALALWSNPTCYEYTYQRSCFCPPEFVEPYRVVVVDDTVVSMTNINDGTAVTDTRLISFTSTMNDIFEDIKKWCLDGCPLHRPAQCEAAYDATDGYVVSLFVDRSIDIIDEELAYTVKDLRIISCP